MEPSCLQKWPALESNPQVLNQFLWGLGVPQDQVELFDVYSLDEEMLEIVPQPVLAVIFLFPDPSSVQAGSSEVADQDLNCDSEATIANLYFIKQIDLLENACGTIALLHSIGNAIPEIRLREDSCLDKFFKLTADIDPSERAAFLLKDTKLQNAHFLASTAGDTAIEAEVEEHFICFTCVNGKLYELDGMKSRPISHGPSSSNSLLQDAVKVIRDIIDKNPESSNYNVMALSRKI